MSQKEASSDQAKQSDVSCENFLEVRLICDYISELDVLLEHALAPNNLLSDRTLIKSVLHGCLTVLH